MDVTTGTIKLKGTFANTDHKLWPGQFVRVTLRLTTQPNAVVVPNEAVQTGQNGSFVYVVKQDRTVENAPVVTGARVDQDMVIDHGLDAGETVVTEGQLRLAPGSKVVVRGPGGGDGKGAGKGGRKSASECAHEPVISRGTAETAERQSCSAASPQPHVESNSRKPGARNEHFRDPSSGGPLRPAC